MKPGEGDYCEGQDTQGGPVDHGEHWAEDKAYLPAAGWHGVAGIDSRNRFHKEGNEKVGEAEIDEKQVGGWVLHLLMVPDGRHNQKIAQDAKERKTHL